MAYFTSLVLHLRVPVFTVLLFVRNVEAVDFRPKLFGCLSDKMNFVYLKMFFNFLILEIVELLFYLLVESIIIKT